MPRLSKAGGVGLPPSQRDFDNELVGPDGSKGLRRLPCILLIALGLVVAEAALIFNRAVQGDIWKFWIGPCLFLWIVLILRQRFLNIGIGGKMFEFIWIPVYNVFIIMRLMSLPEQWVLNPKLDFWGWIRYLICSVLSLLCISGYAWVCIEWMS